MFEFEYDIPTLKTALTAKEALKIAQESGEPVFFPSKRGVRVATKFGDKVLTATVEQAMLEIIEWFHNLG